MAYANLPSALALAKTKSETIAIQMPSVPQLKGRLAAIDPDGVAAFNQELEKFARDLITAISQSIMESPKRETS